MTFNTRAIILRREDFDGPDSRLYLLSETHGKLELVAKGLRREQSKLAAHAQPGALADCFIVQGRKQKLFAGSVIEEQYQLPYQSLHKQYLSGAVLRIADALLPFEQHDEDMFVKLQEALDVIDQSNEGHVKLVPFFYAWQLVVHGGYAQQLDSCVACNKSISNEEKLYLDVRRGGLAHKECADTASPAVELNQAAVKGLRYMTEAGLENCLKLRADTEVFNQICNAIMAVVEERFDIPSRGNFWSIQP